MFTGVFSEDTIEQCLLESLEALGGSKVTTHLPLLAGRFVRERLTAAAQSKGSVMKDRPEVLFVCVHNAGRSQVAASVRSAGSAPADRITPVVVEAMREIGIDLSREFPKPLSAEVVEAADVVVTMGCGDACPVFPGKRYLDWELPDPSGQPLEKVRLIRDDIRERVERLAAELGI